MEDTASISGYTSILRASSQIEAGGVKPLPPPRPAASRPGLVTQPRTRAFHSFHFCKILHLSGIPLCGFRYKTAQVEL